MTSEQLTQSGDDEGFPFRTAASVSTSGLPATIPLRAEMQVQAVGWGESAPRTTVIEQPVQLRHVWLLGVEFAVVLPMGRSRCTPSAALAKVGHVNMFAPGDWANADPAAIFVGRRAQLEAVPNQHFAWEIVRRQSTTVGPSPGFDEGAPPRSNLLGPRARAQASVTPASGPNSTSCARDSSAERRRCLSPAGQRRVL